MTEDLVPIKTALISVSNKSGLIEFAQGLHAAVPKIKILASGGTAKALDEKTIPYTQLSDYTNFPECFNGRVKTLHPYVMGGILFRRGIDDAEAQKRGIEGIDLVVCTLYEFEKAVAQRNKTMQELIEYMDIGGSALIRSACKNYSHVAVVVDPADYPLILQELVEQKGKISLATREHLAVKGIGLSADYESLLAQEFAKQLAREETQRPHLIRGRKLRYGENPDQQAWLYELKGQTGIAQVETLAGKEISYNNYEDAAIAYRAMQDLHHLGHPHGVAIVKHGSLCAYATGPNLVEAFQKAWEGDPKSSFGSVIALSSAIEDDLIPSIKEKFIEVLIAPDFALSFVEWAKKAKPNLRLLKVDLGSNEQLLYKNISGGMLVQTKKNRLLHPSIDQLYDKISSTNAKKVGVVSKKQPPLQLKGLFDFAISAVSYAKSNAIALVREYSSGYYQVLSIGAGQPNRIDSLQRLAIPKAIENLREEHGHDCKYDPKADLEKCVLASDGFFPFDDSIHFAASQGIKYIIQPGGSTRDSEVISAADALDICMILTGERYFYH
jgi:phosphoribosylaminoimidazolecarboxamide formyltransferase / IMP cyclohydrolase